MYFDGHAPPHFHAFYGDDSIEIDIQLLSVIAGNFPPRAFGLVMEWAAAHRPELLAAWEKAVHSELPGRIDPLP
jgi:hypothetical protein